VSVCSRSTNAAASATFLTWAGGSVGSTSKSRPVAASDSRTRSAAQPCLGCCCGGG
jgi:hypothetical protein